MPAFSFPLASQNYRFSGSDMTLPATHSNPKSDDEKAYSISDVGSATGTADDDFPDGGLRAWLIVFGVCCVEILSGF